MSSKNKRPPDSPLIRLGLDLEDRRYGQIWRTTADVPPCVQPVRLLTYHDVWSEAKKLGYRSTREALFACCPYGRWQLHDRDILFDRNYTPTIQRRVGGDWEWYDGPHRVEGIVRTDWFYNDDCPPWRNQQCFNRLQLVVQVVVLGDPARAPSHAINRIFQSPEIPR